MNCTPLTPITITNNKKKKNKIKLSNFRNIIDFTSETAKTTMQVSSGQSTVRFTVRLQCWKTLKQTSYSSSKHEPQRRSTPYSFMQ